jgi:hypothetical protein
MKMQRPRSRKLLDQRKEVIERFVRLAIRRKIFQFAFARARRIARLRLQWTERKRQKAVASVLTTVAYQAVRARRLGLDATTTVLNIALFFLVAERDIQAVKIDALTHRDPWRRGLAARVMLLTIHELDLDKVAGSNLRKALDDGQVPQALRDTLTIAMRTIRKAQSRAQHQFAYLRNATIAHRDPDAIRQYRDIMAIDGLEVSRIAAEFYSGTAKFMEVLPILLSHLSAWPGMISQISAKLARSNGS